MLLQWIHTRKLLKELYEAANNDTATLVDIALCFENGLDGHRKNLYAAILIYDHLYRQGLLGDSFAIVLASYFESGEGLPRPNVWHAMSIFKALAEKGFADAQYLLGDFYWVGHHVMKNRQKAVYWYEKAAMQGMTKAAFYLGLALRYGEGTHPDMEAAASWILKAAEAGEQDAQNYIAHCYEHGLGVECSPEKAAHWYEVLADQGNVDGLYGLGWCYQYGRGVPQDQVEAEVLYRAAIELGDDRAKAQLFFMLHPEKEPEADLVLYYGDKTSFWSEAEDGVDNEDEELPNPFICLAQDIARIPSRIYNAVKKAPQAVKSTLNNIHKLLS